MAEQDTDQHQAEGLNPPFYDVPSSKDTDQDQAEEEEPQSTQMDHVLASENRQETVIDPNVEQQLAEASSSASTNRVSNNDSGEDMEEPDFKNEDPAEESVKPPTEGPSPPDEAALVKSSAPLELDEGSSGDYKTETPRNEQHTVKAEEISEDAGDKIRQEPERNMSPALDDGEDDHTDGPDEGSSQSVSTNTEAGDAPGIIDPNVQQTGDAETDVPVVLANQGAPETIGPNIQEPEDVEPDVPVVIGNQGGSRIYLLAGVLVVAVAILVVQLQSESPPQKDDARQIDVFLRQLEKVKTQFPHQRTELWNRSKIHLLRHLQTAQPTEPVSLILTAGHRAERTLRCLAQSLASAFSSSLNASVLHIDGASKASQDSDQVKLDIDSKLQGAFEGDKPVAVINRFEELPPGSTLIFYRYCDHENAAYKKTCLIFTVLLGEEEEIPAETRLSTVEEMVDDHLQKKFLSEGHPVSFDRMDLDKYGGLWSRISHLILPVAAEERVEHEGC